MTDYLTNEELAAIVEAQGDSDYLGCEHGCERLCRRGHRFCSPECAACEHAPADLAGLVDHAVWCCAGLCGIANGCGPDNDGQYQRFDAATKGAPDV